MPWIGTITNVGNNMLQQQWTEGAVLSIDSAATGTGTVPEISMMAQTALKSQKQTASIISYERVSAGNKITLQITAPEHGYTLNQFGVWASIDDGAPVLLALFQNADGIVVPSISGSPDFAYTFYALLSFSNTGEISVEVDPSSVVTLGTMQTAIAQAVAMKQDVIPGATVRVYADANTTVVVSDSDGIKARTAESHTSDSVTEAYADFELSRGGEVEMMFISGGNKYALKEILADGEKAKIVANTTTAYMSFLAKVPANFFTTKNNFQFTDEHGTVQTVSKVSYATLASGYVADLDHKNELWHAARTGMITNAQYTQITGEAYPTIPPMRVSSQ